MQHWLIVGLGNPGDKYADTRHNIGWMIAIALAQSCKVEFKDGKGNWKQAESSLHGKKITIMLPLTYMNNSSVYQKTLYKKEYFLSLYIPNL